MTVLTELSAVNSRVGKDLVKKGGEQCMNGGNLDIGYCNGGGWGGGGAPRAMQISGVADRGI